MPEKGLPAQNKGKWNPELLRQITLALKNKLYDGAYILVIISNNL